MSETRKGARRRPDRAELAKSWLTLMGESGRKVSMRELAEANGIDLAELRQHVSEEYDLLDAFSAWVDREVALKADVDMQMPPRERVLDVLMERLETMRPYRAGLKLMAGYLKRDVSLALRTNCIIRRSMGWTLTLSGQNPRGFLRDGLRQGLAIAWVRALETWFEDDSADMSKTMARLDRELRRGERQLKRVSCLMKCLPKPPGRRRSKGREAGGPQDGVAEGQPA